MKRDRSGSLLKCYAKESICLLEKYHIAKKVHVSIQRGYLPSVALYDILHHIVKEDLQNVKILQTIPLSYILRMKFGGAGLCR